MEDLHQSRFDDQYGEPDTCPKIGKESYDVEDKWRECQKK
jgi:hypothetical protein